MAVIRLWREYLWVDISEGLVVPWWLGYVERRFTKRAALCVVIPFHIPARLWLKFYRWLRWFGAQVDVSIKRSWHKGVK